MPQSSSINWIEEAEIGRFCDGVKLLPIKASRLSLKDINSRHRRFWRRISKSSQKWIVISVIFKDAWASFESQRADVPINRLKSLESHLSRSHSKSTKLFTLAIQSKAAPDYSRVVSSKGGSAKKADSLHTLMMEVVEQNPAITQRELLLQLRRQEGGTVIVSMDRTTGSLQFLDEYGCECYVANIKDRLSRIKCKIDSR